MGIIGLIGFKVYRVRAYRVSGLGLAFKEFGKSAGVGLQLPK